MTRQGFWFAEMTSNERVTWAACFGGRVLDAMDTQAYALVLPTLIGVFALNRAQAGALGSVTAVVAVITTLFAGVAADRWGRLRVLQAAIAITAISTFFSAFTHSYLQLTLMRAVQGIGYAAELVAGYTLINEAVRGKLRGRAVSAVQSGYAVGYLLALGAMLVVYAAVPEREAWRIMFGIGLVPALYVLVLQKFVPESPLFLAAKRTEPDRVENSSLLDLFRGGNRRNTLVTALIAVGVYGASQILIFWLPTYLRGQYHLNVTRSAGYLALNIIGSFVGPLLYGPVSDRYGRKAVFLLFLAAQALAVSALLMLARSVGTILFCSFLVGLMQGGLATGVQPIIAELFGTPLRGRAMGVNGACIRGVAALSPSLVGVLATASHMRLGGAMDMVAIGLYVAAALGVLMVPETRGTDLWAEIPAAPANAELGSHMSSGGHPLAATNAAMDH